MCKMEHQTHMIRGFDTPFIITMIESKSIAYSREDSGSGNLFPGTIYKQVAPGNKTDGPFLILSFLLP